MNFFLDIDGTLISKGSTLTETFIDVVARAQALGHRFFINTGRPAASQFKGFPWDVFDGYCFGCGTYIKYRGEVLYRRLLSLAEVRFVVDTVLREQPDTKLLLEGEESIYYNFEQPYPNSTNTYPYSTFEELTNKYPNLKIQKFSTYNGTCLSQHTAELLSEQFDVYLHNFYSEIVLKGYDKGSAVVMVERLLKLDDETTVAIGDSYNDLPMLKYCDVSVAMGNAPLEIKRRCSFVTESVEDDGAAKAIAQICGLNYSERAIRE